MHFASFDDICSEWNFPFSSNWYVPRSPTHLFCDAQDQATRVRRGASESVVKVCKVGWNSYFMFCEMFSIWLISLVFCCSKYYILRPQIRFKGVFSVKFSGSGTQSAACHSPAQPSAVMSDLHDFSPGTRKRRAKFLLSSDWEATKSVLDIGESSSLLN